MDDNPYQSPKPTESDAQHTSASRFGASRSRPRRPQMWRGAVGAGLMIGPGFGLIGAQKGLLGLLGVLALDSEFPNWAEYAFHTVIFGAGFFAGVYQWQVWRAQVRAYSTWLRSKAT